MVELPYCGTGTGPVLIWRHLVNAYLISFLTLMALILLIFYIDDKQEATLMNKQDVDRLNDEFLEFVSM